MKLKRKMSMKILAAKKAMSNFSNFSTKSNYYDNSQNWLLEK